MRRAEEGHDYLPAMSVSGHRQVDLGGGKAHHEVRAVADHQAQIAGRDRPHEPLDPVRIEAVAHPRRQPHEAQEAAPGQPRASPLSRQRHDRRPRQHPRPIPIDVSPNGVDAQGGVERTAAQERVEVGGRSLTVAPGPGLHVVAREDDEVRRLGEGRLDDPPFVGTDVVHLHVGDVQDRESIAARRAGRHRVPFDVQVRGLAVVGLAVDRQQGQGQEAHQGAGPPATGTHDEQRQYGAESDHLAEEPLGEHADDREARTCTQDGAEGCREDGHGQKEPAVAEGRTSPRPEVLRTEPPAPAPGHGHTGGGEREVEDEAGEPQFLSHARAIARVVPAPSREIYSGGRERARVRRPCALSNARIRSSSASFSISRLASTKAHSRSSVAPMGGPLGRLSP